MESRDIKRFITGFLVLAIISGSLTLVFSSFYDRDSGTEQPLAKNNNQATPKIGDKALTESIPSLSGSISYNLDQPFPTSSDPGDNFTENLASNLAYSLVKANPEGPMGTEGLDVADLEEQMQAYIQEAALSPVLYNIDEARIKTEEEYTTSQISDYLAAVDRIFSETSGAQGLSRLLADATLDVPDPDALTASNFIFSKAQEDLYALTVPAPMLGLQRSLLGYFELHQHVSDVDYVNDPIKALTYAGKFKQLAQKEEQRVGLELDRMQQKLPEWVSQATDKHSPAEQVRIVLGIREAHAQFGGIVFDPAHTLETVFNGMGIYGSWTQMLTEWLRRLATEVLKDQLIHRLVQQTIQWVQGGGKPQFVTNWKQFLGDAASDAAGAAIGQIEPRLCSGFRPYVVNFLTAPDTPQGYNRLNCTLNDVVNNIENFYADFRSGGWIQFGSLSQPQNNVWGALILSVETEAQEAAAAQQVAQQEAETGRGFLPFKSCVKYDIETIFESELASYQGFESYVGISRCYDSDTSSTDFSRCENDDGSINPNCVPEVGRRRLCDIKLCQAGGKQVTTPGDALAEQVGKSLGSPIDRIVNAEDITALVSALTNSALNRLINLGKKGLLGLFNGSDGNGSGGGTATGGSTGTSGGTTSAENPADVESQRQQVLQLVDLYDQRLVQASSTLEGWDDLATETKSSLSSVRTACSNRSSEAEARIATIDLLAPKVTADKESMDSLTVSLEDARRAIAQATTFAALSTASEAADSLSNTISSLATRVSRRSGQVTQVGAEAEANLEQRSCSTPLSPIDDQ